ncbi:hypothetical protein O6H91_Y505100 [Diphasiastrum complanatum]|nr:hypothetical protein O6H91_Y505100 [Diphasiastrum complanatum]
MAYHISTSSSDGRKGIGRARERGAFVMFVSGLWGSTTVHGFFKVEGPIIKKHRITSVLLKYERRCVDVDIIKRRYIYNQEKGLENPLTDLAPTLFSSDYPTLRI